MALGSLVQPYEGKTEEAGECRFYCRFTVGATGAVPATFTRLSNSITAVQRLSAGKYKFIFDGFFVPGFSAANQNGQMGSNQGASPLLDCVAQIFGNNGVIGTDAVGRGRVIVDNTNNQDASGVSFITIEFDTASAAADPAQNDEINVVFTLKTERP